MTSLFHVRVALGVLIGTAVACHQNRPAPVPEGAASPGEHRQTVGEPEASPSGKRTLFAPPLQREAWSPPANRAALSLPPLTLVDGLSPRSSVCRKLVSASSPPRAACSSPDRIAALATALSFEDAVKRDRALFRLTACDGWSAPMVAALRSALLPACADVILTPLVGSDEAMDAELRDVLVAHHLAAQLERLGVSPPPIRGQNIDAYLASVVRPWAAERLARFHTILEQLPATFGSGPGAAILGVARALGLRSLRAAARSPRIPTAWKKEYETRVHYYGGIDRELAEAGRLLDAADVEAARLISLHGLRHSVACNNWWRATRSPPVKHLLFDRAARPPSDTPREVVASSLPSFFSVRLLGGQALGDPRLLALVADHGLDPELRRRLSHDAEPWQKELLAEYRLAMGLRTRDGMQFDEALALVSELETPTANAQLVSGLARALRGGPRSFQQARDAFRHHAQRESTYDVDLAPLAQFAESGAHPRLRAFALLDLRLFELFFPPQAKRFDDAYQRALSLAPDNGTRGCIQRASDSWSMEPRLKCDLPDAP